MASFGLVNETVPAGLHLAPGVTAGVVKAISITANISSIVALFMPILTYVVPVCKANNVGNRKIWSFVAVFFTSLLFLLYNIPSKHRDTFGLVVNCIGLGVEAVYVIIYLKYTAAENLACVKKIVIAAVAIAALVLLFSLTVVFAARAWSVKIIGIFAATFSTIIFVGGLVDIVLLVQNQVSGFNIYQLITNLGSACSWTSFGFLYWPPIFYTVVPNVVGIVVIILQIISHAILRFVNRGNGDNEAADNEAARNGGDASSNGGDDATAPSNGGDASGNGVHDATAPSNLANNSTAPSIQANDGAAGDDGAIVAAV